MKMTELLKSPFLMNIFFLFYFFLFFGSVEHESLNAHEYKNIKRFRFFRLRWTWSAGFRS